MRKRFVPLRVAFEARAVARRCRIRLIVSPPALLLLACVPVRAADLVFPQAQFLHLSRVEKQPYGQLDLPPGVRLLPLWPARIVAAGTPGWNVPPAPPKSIWTALSPSIYVPPGDYSLVFAGPQPWDIGCVNGTTSMGRNRTCTAVCGFTATMDPAEVAIPWKVAAGERYEVKAEVIVRAPAPTVVWSGAGCRYGIVQTPGYGVADFCLTNTSARSGTAAVPVCRSVRFSVTGSRDSRTVAASATALPPPAVEEPAWLTVTSTPPGADVRINDNFFGKTPAKVKLVAGDYTIAIELPGFTVWKRSLKLVSGSQISVDAQLAPASPPPPKSPPAPPPHAKAVPPPGNSSNPMPAHAARNSFNGGAHVVS
jgi:hypothetical protein